MANFILSSKIGDKWMKVTFDMKSFKLGTCIHIMGKLKEGVSLSQVFFYEQKGKGKPPGSPSF